MRLRAGLGTGFGTGLGAGLGAGGGPGRSLAPAGCLLLWSATGRARAAPGAVAAPGAALGATLGAALGTTLGAGVAAGARAALAVPSAVLKDLNFASVQLCPIELGDGVLHITAGCKLNHPFIFVGSVSVNKGNLSCFSHQVFQVLPADP